MRFILLIILLFAPLVIKADQPRHRNIFTSSNGKYELRILDWKVRPQKWSLVEKESGKVHYEITAWLSSYTVFVSDDGKFVTAIDDYSEEYPAKNLSILFFFGDGKLIKSYTLGQLLTDVLNISSSISHFRWGFHGNKLAVVDSKLSFRTFELTDFTFDTNSGEILKQEPAEILTGDAVYVYGEVTKLKNKRFSMKVCHRIYGTVPESGVIEFTGDGKFNPAFDRDYFSVVIKSGKLVENLGVTLNSCNYKNKK